jgi:hypothetical protein
MRIDRWFALLAMVGALSAVPRIAAAADSSAAASPGFENVDHPLAPGARIRVSNPTLGNEPLVGSFISILGGDTLTFKHAGFREPMRALLDEQTVVEVSTSHHNRAGRYAAIGAILGALIGGVIGDRAQTDDTLGAGPNSASEAGTGPLLLGLAFGAAVGGIVGATHEVDTWVPVRFSNPVP